MSTKEVTKLNLDGSVVSESDLIIGIDLGTTNCAVSVGSLGAVPTLCPLGDQNKMTLQSCVRWDGDDTFTVGAKAYEERYKPNVCYSVKRIMGTDTSVVFEDPTSGQTLTLSPAEVSSKILSVIASRVREFYPGVYKCVITVPAYFNQRQIQDTLKASELAGLECVQILKEPTSASYIYSMLGYAQDGSILVYDLGGGTFDVTVMSFLKKSSIPSKVINALKRMYKIDVSNIDGDRTSLYFCRVLGTYGDMLLGGDDLDREIAREVSKGIDATEEEFEELVLRCEQFKKGKMAAQDIQAGEHLYHISQENLERATRVIFNKTLDILNSIPEEQLASVKTVVLVGGSTKNQYLLSMLADAFPDMEISRVLDPDATVALGAGAVAKDLMEGKGQSYQDVLPLAIGVLENENTVDVCIPKNTALPYTMSRTYRTLYDNQQCVNVLVYQGLDKNPANCTFLGNLRVENLPPAPAGELEVTVSFLLSAQGKMKVTSTVDGVSTIQELVVESIFDVNTDNKTIHAAGDEVFDRDIFERSYGAFADNPEVRHLLLARRSCLDDETRVQEIEELILNAIYS